jgi:hypothetical protein
MKEYHFKISSRVKVKARSQSEATIKFQEFMEEHMDFPGMRPESGIFLSIEDALEDWDTALEYELDDYSSEDELTEDDLRLNHED